MYFVAKINPQRLGMLTNLRRLLHESILSLLDEIVVAARPKTPGITRSQFPAKCDAPKHGNDFDVQFGAKVEQAQNVIFDPFLDFIRGFLCDIGWNEWTDGGRSGP